MSRKRHYILVHDFFGRLKVRCQSLYYHIVIIKDPTTPHKPYYQSWSWVTFSKPNPTQNFWTQPNPQKSSPDPTQPIIDTWYGILGYTENFIQQLLHVTDKFTVRSYAVLINRQWSISWRHAVKSQFSVKWHWYSDTFSCNFSVALYILCMLVLCSFHDFFCNFGILINEILH